MKDKIKLDIPSLPHKPGVYLMHDDNDKIIYVGKAKDLYKRVSQYFLRPQFGKVEAMVNHVNHFTYIITNNEKEAFILEMNLIHEHMPRYNILLKDNSHYPYIALSKANNPVLKIMRNTKDKKHYYFGPFPNSGDAYKVIDLLNKIFPLRKCRNIPSRPCLYKDLGLCLAPCVNKIDIDVYSKMVEEIRSFLSGNDTKIKEDIKSKMIEASNQLDYEKANEFKNTLKAIDEVNRNQNVEYPNFKSIDIIAYSSRESYLSISILTYRNGILLGKANYINPSLFNDEEDVINLIEQYYSSRDIPNEIAINLNNSKELEETLSTKIVKSSRGHIYEAISIAEQNAKDSLDKYFLTSRLTDDNLSLLNELGKLLKIKTPYHIELIDNSHLQGSDPISALVVYINGEPNKKMYRKFHIESNVGNDDFASMREVVKRRYERIKEEKLEYPDLLLLDGGLPQLNAIKEKYPFPIFGLYKDDKHSTKGIIDKKGKLYPIDNKSPLFFLLMRMQDEVHRFAISFHKKERNKHMFKSIFDDIKGLGKKRLETLLKQYQDIDELKKASEAELSQILNKEVASVLYKKLHSK